MSLNVEGGMRLAQVQPQMVNGPVIVKDPKRHRLGIQQVRIGSAHRLVFEGHAVSFVVQDATNKDLAAIKARVVCLHPGCSGKSWASEEELVKDHRPHGELVKAGEVHLWGWFSSEPKDDGDSAQAFYARLVQKGEAWTKKLREECNNAKDFDALESATNKLMQAEKSLAGAKQRMTEQRTAIHGLLSKRYMESE